MITSIAQRWRDRRAVYRRRGEAFSQRTFDVARINSDRVARSFVEKHHYSGSYVVARERFGLYRRGAFVGVAVFSVPCHPAVITNWFPLLDWRAGLELGRFVLLDEVEFNAESWFLARCRELLARDGYLGIVSFADDTPRTDESGATTFAGHVGTIYQASNAVLAGRGKSQTAYLLPNGRTWHRRNRGKIINLDNGWRGAVAQLASFGAARFDEHGSEDCRRAWLEAALARVARPLRHPGNLRYLWALNRRIRRFLPRSDPYPKLVA